MKNIFFNSKLYLLYTIIVLTVLSCTKGSKQVTPTPQPPTTLQLLTSASWKISGLTFFDETLLLPWDVAIPDSLHNVVLTLKSDNTFTETGGKTASGTWAFDKLALTPSIYITTTSTPTSVIPWSYKVTATQFSLLNMSIENTYVNPSNTLQPYIGEEQDFTH